MTLAMAGWPPGLVVERDEEEVRAFVVRDMLHLDADALHDRLHAWTLARLGRVVPAAAAVVSFRHARPAAPEEESTLDAQEGWLGLEPMLVLDLRAARAGDEERLAALAPEFLALLEQEGRPPGFRSPEVGTME